MGHVDIIPIPCTALNVPPAHIMYFEDLADANNVTGLHVCCIAAGETI